MQSRLIMIVVALAVANVGCPKRSDPGGSEAAVKKTTETTRSAPETTETEGDDTDETEDMTAFERQREAMVDNQIAARGVEDERILTAMKKIPRHEFVPEEYHHRAYYDAPSPIGHRQTISQPYIVAWMTELLDAQEGAKILEIGTGSGYQAAVLAELGVELYTIEIICDLAERAEKTLDDQGYDNVTVRCGDGYKGWPDQAPFDGIIVTAAPPEIPSALVDQLADDGRMVVPVGERYQKLKLITKNPDGTTNVKDVANVQFVPMVPGEEE